MDHIKAVEALATDLFAIVREIAQQMHGDLELTTEASGTTVVLRFGDA